MENVVICRESIIVKRKPKSLCIHDGCDKRSYFNIIGETRPQYCNGHKEPDMVNVKEKRKCEHEGCNKKPSYNYPDKTNGLFCNSHKQPEMVDVVSKRCEHEGCNKRPSFNYINVTTGGFCFGHKQPAMVDVINKKCEYEGCNKQPKYNYPDKTTGKFCNGHKEPEMVNVVNKNCEHEGCNKQPYFNNPDETVGRFCNGHKEPDMVDVVSKQCEYDGCNKHPCFNFKNIKRKRFCFKHKEPEMVNVVNKTCVHEWCDTRVKNKKYDGYCFHCYIDEFPLNTITRNYKTKENAVVEFIKLNFPEHIWIANKTISGGCSRRRPDLLLHLKDYVIIIEINENQHISYDGLIDNIRTLEILQDLNKKPTVFIRFNPDDYKIDNKKITSCWRLDNNGDCIMKKSKETEWIERLNALKEKVNHYLTNKPTKEIEIFKCTTINK